MTLTLTPEQTEQVRHLLEPGQAVLGRVQWRAFSEPERIGELVIELGAVPEISLPALRQAIREVTAPRTTHPKTKHRKKR